MSGSDPKYKLDTEYGLEVYRTDSDMIAIKQDDPFEEEGPTVILSPERVDRLVAFLRAVKDEILTDRADEAEKRATRLDPPLSNG